MTSEESVYPKPRKQHSIQRQRLSPEQTDTFKAFSRSVFSEGALSAKTKQLIAVAAAHVTQCPYCISAHTDGALRRGATPEEIMEAIWIATEMRAGAAYAHSVLALERISHAHETGDEGE